MGVKGHIKIILWRRHFSEVHRKNNQKINEKSVPGNNIADLISRLYGEWSEVGMEEISSENK